MTVQLQDLTSLWAKVSERWGLRIDDTGNKEDPNCWAITGRAFVKEDFEGRNVVGGHFQGYSQCKASAFGLATEAWSYPDCDSGHLLNEVSLISRDASSDNTRKRGLDVVFKNRRDTDRYGKVEAGVGDNCYNEYANAIVVTSQARSQDGEYCGWIAAIRLGPHALDRSASQPFSSIIDYRSCGYDSNGEIPYRYVWKHKGVQYGEVFLPARLKHQIWSHIDTAMPNLVKEW